MATIRIFTEDDVPAVVALFERVYPEQRWTSPAACEAYFREILFGNPWRDLDLPSWVAEEDGRMAVSLTLWKTREDCIQYHCSRSYRQFVAKTQHLLLGDFVVKLFKEYSRG